MMVTATEQKQVFYEDVEEGEEIPSIALTPSSQQLVHWAAGSGDFYQIHYDPDFAKGTGLQGIIVHGALKHALLAAYHARAENASARDVLLGTACEAGLDGERASAILDGDEFAADVRERERHWHRLGIHAVPAVVIEGTHLISGGQPVEVFEAALRRIAENSAVAAIPASP